MLPESPQRCLLEDKSSIPTGLVKLSLGWQVKGFAVAFRPIYLTVGACIDQSVKSTERIKLMMEMASLKI